MMEFVGMPKIARLSRDIIITEKIDGTNAQICITPEGDFLVGSKTRWITPEDDNYGFARWAMEHKDELMGLGPGRHMGEWWGSGINRGYGLTKGEKRFSLFNVSRWCNHDEEPNRIPMGDPRIEKYQERLPECCRRVPMLYRGPFDTEVIDDVLHTLMVCGSVAMLRYDNPEGIVVFHTGGNVMFKKTLNGDGHKGAKNG